ncbi:L,D-transpeptidase family protein [Clostridium sp. NSJ-145]|uniref:L,D-transpeptidase family protein n=1 Tax=Clostridium sp. NSJ-145 TaxID=2897777 RepID=UPI001E564BBA|nr:L,D-transpeptidase family protein [Clostridium sp. NSJ-145]MCD2500797.1 L,D-transpeptidase family protein [Clostridium sp. NSJ-145]
MGRIKDYIIKRRLLIIILLVIIVAGVGIINVGVAKAEERKRISIIEDLISEGSYDDAIEKIDELTEKYSYKLDKKITDYRSILETYRYIDSCKDSIEIKEIIELLKEDYSELLKDNIFIKLNESLLQKQNDIDNHIKEMENINIFKVQIEEAIDRDIEEAKTLIEIFKRDYPDEDILALENKLKEKIGNIENEKELLKEDETVIEEVEYEKDINNSTGIQENKLGIANTVAAQNSSQIITVVSNGGSYGELVMWQKDGNGNWVEVERVAARLGQNGMKYASEVYEMDKCTPTGIYTVTEAFGINSNPGSGVPYRELDGSEYWVDDVDSEYYNTMQFGDPNGRWNSAEKLVDFPGYYNYSLVIDYNRWPVIPGKSSAIFLHCDMGIYTYGCVAIPQNNLVNLLTWLDPNSNPVMILDFTYEDIYNNY